MARPQSSKNQAAAYQVIPTPHPSRELLRPFILLILLALAISFHLITTGKVPSSISDDDGAYSSAAYTFWKSGFAGVPGYNEILNFNRDIWAFGRMHAALQGVVMHFKGVSVFNAMLPSFFLGIALLVGTYGLGRTLFNERVGLLAAVLLALSGKFFLATHSMRPDLLLAVAFVYSLWFLAASQKENPLRTTLIAGILMGVSADIHINAVFLTPLPFILWIRTTEHAYPTIARGAIAYLIGIAVGLTYWFLLRYSSDPQMIQSQMTVMGSGTHGFRLMNVGVLGAIHAEIQRYMEWFWDAKGHRHLLEGMFFIGTIGWLLYTRHRNAVTLIILFASFFVISTAFFSNPFGWYLVYIWPILTLIGAAAIEYLPHPRTRATLASTVILAYCTNLGLWTWKAINDTPHPELIQKLRATTSKEEPILANGSFWFAFWDYKFTDFAYLDFLRLDLANKGGRLDSSDIEYAHQTHEWRKVVASHRYRRLLDPNNNAEDFGPRTDQREVLEMRSYLFKKLNSSMQIGTGDNTVLVFNIRPSSSSTD